ncbi:alpha/beta hydrolase [Planococcus salinus]|uniref:Serine hydrolase family protein n=1 Tax=Planococcus salinus TaxID=1848460 RepID=A0A3M8P5Q5_9BACL|nr:alpha/beta hydrolase [Planococcus salinus]RNF39009.1 serine hydrolase family protein [Planococcus salinus]
MKKQALFIHSAGPQGKGEGSTGLLEYLQKELGDDLEWIAPQMPNPENPAYAEWQEQLRKEIGLLDDGAILVGHSIGGSALLKFLSEEELGKKFTALFTVAAPYWGINDDWKKEDFTLAENFTSRNSLLPKLVMYHSAGDPVVPFSHVERYAKELPSADIRKLEGGDHLFLDGLPELVEEIRNQ